MQRRFFLRYAAALVAPAVTVMGGIDSAQAQPMPPAGFPSRPIRLVIAFPAGGQTDLSMRTLAANAARILGQPVIVVNKPGAGGILPVQQLLHSAADGYTLAQIPLGSLRPSMPLVSGTEKGRRADSIDDMMPVIGVTGYSVGLMFSADSPLTSWAGFTGWAQAYLGKLVYGSTSAPLTLDLLAQKLGQKVQQMLQDGSAKLSGSLVANNDALERLIRSRTERTHQLPPAPTLKELGLGLVQNPAYGIGAPRGTPPAVVKRLHDAFKSAMAQENFRLALVGTAAPQFA